MQETNFKLKEYISNKDINLKTKELAEKINEDYFKQFKNNETLYAICVLKGAVLFFCELIKYLKMPVKIQFVTLSSYKGMNSTGKVSSDLNNLENLNGKNVLVVEDIVDTGISLDYFIKLLNSTFKINYLKTVTLLNKNERRKVEFKPDYYGFNIEDKFVVGYGMDYNELFRNLDHIAYIELQEK